MAVCVLFMGLNGMQYGSAQDLVVPTFKDVAEESGILFRHNFGDDRLKSVLMTTGSGTAFFDYDNDGWLDAFLVNGTGLDKHGNPRADRASHHALFHNQKDGTFRNVTEQAGFTTVSYGQGIAIGDYDGDGFDDVYITNYGPNQLYRNRGDGTFEDVTERSGTGEPHWGTGAVFFDFDQDGDLDLFAANYVQFRADMQGVHASSLSKRSGFRFFPGPRDYAPEDDHLFRNNGDGTFTDVSNEAGLVSGGKGLTAIASDFDNDGDQDLFVANDASPNFLYENEGGHFREIATRAGVAYDPNGEETAAMGVDVADIDNDGNLDLYVTNMVFEYNNLYHNEGEMIFEEITKRSHLDTDNYRHAGWATRFSDFNHDGHLDCFVANGHVIDYIEGMSQSVTYGQQNMVFLGDSRGHFKNVTGKTGKAFQMKSVTRGASFGDYDNDGDIDILISNSGESAELLRNDTPTSDRWLGIRLKGRAPNTHGIGARVTVTFKNRTVSHEVRFAPTYLSSSDPTINLGLLPGENEGSISVDWPSGKTSTRDLRVGTVIEITESK